MKSKLFTKYFVPTEAFGEHTKILLELPIDCRKDFAQWFNNLKIEPSRLDSNFLSPPEVMQNLLAKLCISSDKFDNLHNYVKYITRMAYNNRDDIHDIVDDMVALGYILEESKNDVQAFFDSISEKGVEVAKQRRRSIYEKGQIPDLTYIDYNVDLRLLPEEPFRPLEQKIEDYQPKGLEFIPVALITVKTNDGENKKITSFQVNFSELEDMIVTLQACQKELRLLQNLAQRVDISSLG